MALTFQRATKAKSKLRLALTGPAGSGKSYTSLVIGQRLAEHARGRMAVIDTERGSASLYADLFEFDVLELDSYHPQRYIDAIHAAEQAGYAVIVIDSLSHAWAGKDGALAQVDNAAARDKGANRFTAWRDVTPLQEELVHSMLGSPAHVVATMRVKTEYVMEQNERGKMVPRKIGMAPVQRDQIEYEFTLVGDLDTEHKLVITKSRIPALADAVIRRPDGAIADQLITWLESGAEPTPRPAPQPEPEPQRPAATQQHTNGTNGSRPMTQAQAIPRRDETPPSDAAPYLKRPASEPQIRAIYAIARGAHVMDDATVEEYCRNRFGCLPAELTRAQAADIIEALKKGASDTAAAAVSSPADAARDAFTAVCRGKTARQVCDLLGIDPNGDAREAITYAANAYGYDRLRKCMEDGVTIERSLQADAGAQPEPPDIGEQPALIAAGSTAYPDGR